MSVFRGYVMFKHYDGEYIRQTYEAFPAPSLEQGLEIARNKFGRMKTKFEKAKKKHGREAVYYAPEPLSYAVGPAA